jgi:alpha-ketoglutarate-dependent taurine dioxygenase
MPLEPEHMKTFYKAYVRFTELLLDSKSSFWYKMKNGDGISINNFRVLHARTGYKNSANNYRVFQLAYMDWDCIHSKIRILSDEQGIPSPV